MMTSDARMAAKFANQQKLTRRVHMMTANTLDS
jgi:hypothetical protein